MAKETKTVASTLPESTLTEREQAILYLEERVPIQLFKDDNKYKDDLPVCVNGETILIKRGYKVMIKRKHALVILAQNRQELVAIRVSEGFEGYKKMD